MPTKPEKINPVRNSHEVLRPSRKLLQVNTPATGRRGIISNGINLENILEALLFTYGDGLDMAKLAATVKKSISEIETALKNLKNNLAERGLKLINKDSEWQMVTDGSAAPYIEKLVKSELRDELSPASVEVLSIVAYKNGATRTEIETIRGVNSIYALRNLALRGLVEKSAGELKSSQYQISLTALRKLGIEKIEHLPRFSELQNELGKVESLLKN
ncbi:MAG: SMC-Scp complex subunit ScpB [Patescibacteria group bacterium]